MNKSEISEIRRRFKAESTSISAIYGCYVNNQKEIVSTFRSPFLTLPPEESEKYLALFKRTLSGQPEKNLLDIAFHTQQVLDSDEHRLLMQVRDSALKDEAAVNAFFERMIASLDIESNYLILLIGDAYDVPFRSMTDPDDLDNNAADAISEEVYRYILCCVCPVRQSKPALSYYSDENAFHNRILDWVVESPELGFLFPAFDERRSNIYNALLYTKDAANSHDSFVSAMFCTDAPMPAAEQKETFQDILAETLEEDCCYEVMQTVHSQLMGKIEESKAAQTKEIPVISGSDVCSILENCGVSEAHMDAFNNRFEEKFGQNMNLSATNIANTSRFEVRTPDVLIRVNPDRSDLVETRVINGQKYILIRAEEGVEVNGINIRMPQES